MSTARCGLFGNVKYGGVLWAVILAGKKMARIGISADPSW
jgi:hypothetical protein